MSRPQPSSESEVQLYQILQRANLLQYYDTFISQGGDDVQQLCEAGEEEFLEIMALVGMASKPLHVRRLQKALQEWAVNPVNFQQSIRLNPTEMTITQGSILSAVQKRNFELPNTVAVSAQSMLPIWTSQAVPVAHTIEPQAVLPSAQGGLRPEPISNKRPLVENGSPAVMKQESSGSRSNGSPEGSIQSVNTSDRTSVSPVPGFLSHNELGETQIKAIEMAAAELGKTLPEFDLKLQNVKKHISKEIEAVIAFTNQNPNHPDVIHLMRKYAAIYGRFDSKRKGEKRMTLHEVSVNEAASQLCCHRPNLLTQREVLFPLARQVVRESGYQYSKGHSRSVMMAQNVDNLTPNKKAKMDLTSLISKSSTSRQSDLNSRLMEINEEIAAITKRQDELKTQMEAAKKSGNLSLAHNLQGEIENYTSKQLLLLSERSEITTQQRVGSDNSGNSLDDSGQKTSLNESEDDEALPDLSGCSSPVNGLDTSLLQSAKNKESLFDAGMRVAQAYGLGEFAQELKGLKDTELAAGKEPDKRAVQIRVIEVDEQEEWNRSVEEDWKQQELARKNSEK